MNKQLVLAEKPSVGRELARVLGCKRREKGYFEGDTYVVTWALGHLIELAQPAEYDGRYKRWSLQDLPMLPKELKQSVMEQTADQYKVVESLMKRDDMDNLIIATDAGREGELVARWIIRMASWKGPIQRLWISSQTDEAIKEGFSHLKDGSLYENLFAAAESRAAADWYVGMNVTRALTCQYDAKLSAGRVQTPTLALITKREEEIEAFLGSFYWTLRADFGICSATWQDEEGSSKILSEEHAENLKKELNGKTGVITAIQREEKKELPPLAYDLTELQRDANLHLSFSAKETLDILQRLYEQHKIVTYPRTDSRYITEDIVPTLAKRLRALEATPFGQLSAIYALHGYRTEMDRFVMTSGVTDHHAIIPTEQPVDLQKLSKEEKALWELIALRFMEVLSEDYQYESTTITIMVGTEQFISRSTKPLKQGWKDMARLIGKRKNLSSAEDLASEESTTDTQEATVGDTVTLYSVRTRKTATPPPDRYTEASLLSAMEHAGRFVEDASLKKHLSGGLGTPATRAEIIEKLIQNHYIEREGKQLIPTPKGRELVRLSPNELCSPELTAQWEHRLASIAEGKETKKDFISDIIDSTKELVSVVSRSKERFSPQFSDGKVCQYCSSPMMKAVDEFGQVHFICQRLSCSYEEALIKRKKQKDPQKEPIPTGTSEKKILVSTKTMAASSATGKKIVVVKKQAKKEPAEEWETVLEVVRPSKLLHTRASHHQIREREPYQKRDQIRDIPQKFSPQSDSGATFADLLAASEKRKKERDKRKKK